MGPVALHGGGEFRPGDEPFLLALLDAAAPAVDERRRSRGSSGADGPDAGVVRIAILPTAAARQRPDLAMTTGEEAFRRVASTAGREVRVDGLPIVDHASANASHLAGILAGADVVYLTGGDPDVIPSVLLPGTLALRSVLAARARGAVVAGASAGAMALARWTWTPAGGMPGLGLVRGVVIVPHFERQDPVVWRSRLARLDGRHGLDDPDAGGGLGLLGLDEQTGILSLPDDDPADGVRWRVVGRGRCLWYPPAAEDHDVAPVVARTGEELSLDLRS